jgi:hypothetical protein
VRHVYLLVHSPIVAADFDSLRTRQPQTSFPTAELECQAHGISVFEQIEHIRRVKRRVRWLRNRAIALGQLDAETGVVKPTSSQFGDSHRTWWRPTTVDAQALFAIVEFAEET